METYEDLLKWARKLDANKVLGFSTDQSLSSSERSLFYRVGKKIARREDISFKQISWFRSVYLKLESGSQHATKTFEKRKETNGEVMSTMETKHLCLRTAWHDSKWNGKICNRPDENIYCVGEYSLLSDRVRKRRDLHIECKLGCAGCKPDKTNMGEDYQPPCFWSINAFGTETLTFYHDNPVAINFPKIEQGLPPYSIISWPFNLSFVKDAKERKKYNGSYYPKDIFENRVKLFQHGIKELESVVFLYANRSNPVSGEDMKFLVTGCALMAEKGDAQRFDISEEELRETAEHLKQPNFPSLNWALRYTLDFENSGVRLPYHEYLEKIEELSGIDEEKLQQIAVTIEEPELREGFTYVAKHIDDDQAIYLLTKIRRSLLKVEEHNFLQDYDTKGAIQRIEKLLKLTWSKRGYLPGLGNLLNAIPGLKENYGREIKEFSTEFESSNDSMITELIKALVVGSSELRDHSDALFFEVEEFLNEFRITANEFLVLASLSLTENQFRRIINRNGIENSLAEVCQNPYLLHETYVEGEDLVDQLTGEKIDGSIDLFKIDVALIPLAKYQKRISSFHIWRVTDIRRVRAVVIEILRNREHKGDCWLDIKSVAQAAEVYSLFYKTDTVYDIESILKELTRETEIHLLEKLVIKHVIDGDLHLYLKELYDDETFVKNYIEKLCDRPDRSSSVLPLEVGLKDSVTKLRSKIGDRFDADLFIAERKALYADIGSKSFYVITGSPGAGKSYELLNIIDFFNKKNEISLVLSLTGKAVLRLLNNEEGFTGVEAKTIDKYLKEQEYEKAQSVTNIIHNLIIDESSMVDLPKLASVLRNLSNSHLKRLILVGDPNQLPPIGFGKPFYDIVEHMAINADRLSHYNSRLEVNCRAELSDSFIEFTKVFANENKFAEEYLAQTEERGLMFDKGVEVVTWENRDDLNEKITTHVHKLVSESGCDADDLSGFLGINDNQKPQNLDCFQVISPYRNGYFGVSGLNLHFQDVLRKNVSYERESGDVVFKLHDKVMHTENEYRNKELFVSNGSLGAIVSRGRVYFVDHDQPVRLAELRTKDKLELAYAVTVHKAQGSGFNHVFIVLPEKARYSSRELVYTALTRVRKKVILFIQKTCDNQSVPEFLAAICNQSAVLGRRTSLFADSSQAYAYSPEKDVVVKSRVEYIIYRKLLDAKEKYGNFTFEYEKTYQVKGEKFNFHPDFVLTLNDGREIFWEHLGMVNSKSYLNTWDKRRKIYEYQGDIKNVLTTDELKGISDLKIEGIIMDILGDKIQSEDNTNRYSKMHYSLI